jgi:hypothetical protein
VRMWKLSLVAKAVENVHYVEEHMNLTGVQYRHLCMSWIRLGRPLGHFPGEGAQGHLHMVTELHQGQ